MQIKLIFKTKAFRFESERFWNSEMAYCIHRLNLEVKTASEHGDRKMRNRNKLLLSGVLSGRYCCFFRSLRSTFAHTQNAPVVLRGRYQTNFNRQH